MPENCPHPAIRHLFDSIQLAEPRIHGGIGLWPIIATPSPKPAYITLVEAQTLEGFSITEVSEDGSVPSLRVVNGTPENVMLFDGEELKGAKQNRILNTTILIEAGTQLDVPVSCTEQGRWSYESHEFSSSGNVAYSQLRKAKSKAVAVSLSASEGHASDQGEVWQEIEALHECAESSDKSQTRAMEDAYRERQREIEEFVAGLSPVEGQCGLLSVVGKRVEGVDVLSRPEAYARLHKRLVESHAMDFIVRKKARASRSADPEAPQRFLKVAAGAAESTHDSPGLGVDHRLRFQWGHGSALRVDETIIHLALFGERGLGIGHHPSEPPLRRSRGRR